MAIKQEEEAPVEVQLTPLIDCVFLLLIFFLVSSQLKKVEKRLEVDLPRAHVVKTYKQTPDIISVGVNARGSLFVNARAVGAGGLLDALREAKAAAPGRRAVIDGDVQERLGVPAVVFLLRHGEDLFSQGHLETQGLGEGTGVGHRAGLAVGRLGDGPPRLLEGRLLFCECGLGASQVSKAAGGRGAVDVEQHDRVVKEDMVGMEMEGLAERRHSLV